MGVGRMRKQRFFATVRASKRRKRRFYAIKTIKIWLKVCWYQKIIIPLHSQFENGV